MTREEAIRRLKNMAWLYGSVEREPHIEAIDMAIESLQAECEDYEHATLVDIKEPLKVSVVRCKDCVHWLQHEQFGFDEDNDEYHDYCALLVSDDDYYAYTRKADDFCSYGERRESTE